VKTARFSGVLAAYACFTASLDVYAAYFADHQGRFVSVRAYYGRWCWSCS